jgi:hypothetical protein
MDTGDITWSDQKVDQADRHETSWIALIRLPDGTEIPTVAKDLTLSSARLAVPGSYDLPDRFMFKLIGRDFVCAAQLEWRWGDNVKVRIDRVGKLPPPAMKAPASTSVGPTATLRARRSPSSQG